MRIALLAPLVTPLREAQLGGSQAFVADLASGLVSRGHDVHVVASSGSSIDGVDVIDTGVDPGSLRASLYRADGAHVRASSLVWEAFERAYSVIAGGRYDLVHNHAFDAAAIELGADAGCPVVHTLHLPPDPVVAAAIERSRPAAVACVSRAQAAAWGIELVLRNGVPVDRIGWSSGPGPAALFAGRFSPEKGAAEAVEIARRAGVEVVLAGGAYDEVYASGFKHIGPLERPRLWRLMASSRALLCPVRWDEPFGLAAAEAQAAGTPVIGFRRGGLVEVVRDGETGALVDGIDEAAEALRTVHRFDRTACRRHAELHLSLDAALDAHEDLYTRVARWVMAP